MGKTMLMKRFRDDLVRREATVSQTKGKRRIHVSLRLQLPSRLIAAQEDGFEIEPVLRKAFADLRRRLDRQVARLRHEPEWERPTRRRRIAARIQSGTVDPFDRYMLADPDRAERIEHCLVELATRYLNATVIENDDLDDAALARELNRALGRPAP